MITQEDFDKLKQSDRIELLLRENRLDEKKRDSNVDWIGILYILCTIMAFIVLVSMQFKILGLEESFISIFNLLLPIGKIMIVVGVIGVCWNLIMSLYIFPKWDKKLESYFFNFKTEVKNKK